MGLSLTELAVLSETKRNLLLLLRDEPKSFEEIKEELSLSTASAFTHTGKLKKAGLLDIEDSVCSLSDMAKVIVENLKELMDFMDFFDENLDYWTTHNLTPIPSCLLNSIDELGQCELLKPDAAHLIEIPRAFLENIRESKRVLAFLSYFHPETPSLYAGLAKNDVDLSLCLTEKVFERFSRDFPAETKAIMASGHAKLLICRENAALPEVVATDRFMAIRLFEESTKFRNQLIISLDPGALQWGRELYRHYEKLSDEINGPQQRGKRIEVAAVGK
ncbi:winged helix-turn-helix domain-containing protein [Methanosarcina sp. KYL-1]|uniref:helix-turn-helix transcriptional regulator n=1 Tax=Methanosarcina sp. KYL-1 TaxID=2602068 RepID=UPI002100ABFD|nr:winged helix-turn-helix domain-containing protein [Methanosarcina sp. KYL-1]